jgi:hypothetical protein
VPGKGPNPVTVDIIEGSRGEGIQRGSERIGIYSGVRVKLLQLPHNLRGDRDGAASRLSVPEQPG